MDVHRVAFNTWQEKTEWVQKDKRFDVLLPWGKHRADVLKEYIDHLEAKCAALAAENAGLKERMDKIAAWPNSEFYASAWEFNNNDGYALLKLVVENDTPVTDAFLAEVRAQGVEMFASKCKEESKRAHSSDVRDSWWVSGESADDFAAQIRKGVQS